jgi:predicted ATP-dependent endonuclease of OLD family
MFSQIQEFVTKDRSMLVDQVAQIRRDSVETVREAVAGSADSIKTLKSPVRTLARTGIKLTNVSQSTLQNLIELQSDMVTSAITDAANRLERASRASNVVDLVQAQIKMLPATRDRIVDDANRAVDIFKTTGRDLRDVAGYTFDRIIKPLEDEIPTLSTMKKNVRKTTAKTKAKGKRTAVKTKAKTKRTVARTKAKGKRAVTKARKAA